MSAAMPIKPMLAKKQDAPAEGDEWIIEPKLDGWRFLFHVTAGDTRAYAGRNAADRTGQIPETENALGFLPDDTILDGEVICLNDPTSPAVATALALPGQAGLQFVAFDILRLAGHDLTGLPWTSRRELLEKAAEGFTTNSVKLLGYQPAKPEIHEAWLGAGFEGSVAKRKDSTYRPGQRGWAKVKPQTTDEAVVIGFEQGKNGWADGLGAFQLRMLESGVETTCAIPTDQMRKEVTADPDAYRDKTIEIRHHGLMNGSGKPRHPIFHRWRPDRDPE